jgi:hypothetical protein
VATRSGSGENGDGLENKDDGSKGNGVATRTDDRDSSSELKGEGDELGNGGDDGVAVGKGGGEGGRALGGKGNGDATAWQQGRTVEKTAAN